MRITITGDTTHEALQSVINQGINKYGRDFQVLISPNLRFEHQNQEVKEYFKHSFSNIGHDAFQGDKLLDNCKCERCNEYQKFKRFLND